jgi:hypothetical protein
MVEQVVWQKEDCTWHPGLRAWKRKFIHAPSGIPGSISEKQLWWAVFQAPHPQSGNEHEMGKWKVGRAGV